MSESISGGYNGKILRINLSNNVVGIEKLDSKFCRKYLGGTGFITYFLLKEVPEEADALGPENKLVFASGPVTGTSIIGSGRHSVGAKSPLGESPLGGGIAWSGAGGYWGAELKRSGFDAVIVEGKSSKPVYIWIHDGEASILDAGHLWGKNTKETQQDIRSELGDEKIQVALIGPGGENKVRFACLMHGLHDTAGRGGVGAVMGSKNMKAIAVRGHNAPKVAKPERLKEISRFLRDNLYKDFLTAELHDTGTGGPLMEHMPDIGDLPVRNWRDGLFPEVSKIHAGVIKETIRVGMEGCFGCPVRCKKVVKFDEPYVVDPAYGGPEYEALAALGSNCGIDDLRAIAKANELCNAYSLDVISTGGVISFAMECFERGLLSLKDTGGIELRFGSHEAMLKCVEMIARRQGFGNILAEGTAQLVKRLGRGSEEYAMHVKGLDAGQHEPRRMAAFGLGFMVNPHGADHCCNAMDSWDTDMGLKAVQPLGFLDTVANNEINPLKVALFKTENTRQLMFDCLVMCHLYSMLLDFKTVSDIIEAVTGWDTSVAEQIRVGERIFTSARLFNIRQGLTAKDDKLPKRYFQPTTDGPLSKAGLDPDKMEKARKYYYTIMGWDKEGIPLPEKLEELGIDF